MSVTVQAIATALPASLLVEVRGDTSSIVVDLTHDSREVDAGWAFACVVGDRTDGHNFASAAVEAGATALVVERPVELDVAQIVVTDVRRALGSVAAVVHDHPSDRLELVGITGTNGKTTTAQMLGAVLSAAGREVRVLGTLTGVRTTPEAPELQRQLAAFVAEGVDAVVMEVSSHAMVYRRVGGCRFAAVAFTNLGQDHLDLHGSMEAYFRAKASLFEPELGAIGVTNIDDTHGRLLLDVGAIDMVGFGAADASNLHVGVRNHSFMWRDQHVSVPVGGDFNVLNSLAALTIAEALGIEPAVAAAGIGQVTAVPGRFETVSTCRHAFDVVVDYAHTPDGLGEVLRSARRVATDGRVIAVFGAAGDRDHEKRVPMGAIGAELADVAIVTSDNPRSEAPASIVAQVAAGADNQYAAKVIQIVDRREAIERAIRSAQPGDVVVIAGKGHETTQTVGDERRPFDDRVVSREILDAIGASDLTGDLS